jgi:hypothetical protein
MKRRDRRPVHAPVHVLVPSALLIVAGPLAVGCGEPAPGQLAVGIYGEDFIERGIPASAFHDGWAVTFESFLVGISDVTAASGAAPPELRVKEPYVFELARPTDPPGTGTIFVTASVAGGSYDDVSYRIAPPPAGALSGPGVDPAAVSALAAAGESVRVRGVATKGTRRVAFAWGFPAKVLHSRCRGKARVDGNTARTEITIHGDHLFYDDLFAEEPNVAFELVAAADADGDGQVTKAELLAKDITKEARYQVGSEKISNLWDFVARQVTTIGHIDGEGHCDTKIE